ncbi:GrpB family protein [bacterium]|nr:GrpB family protein [bacterium]
MTATQRIIEVVPYDPVWVALFDKESSRIKEVFTEGLIEVHHIGSTSVPGLVAKPIIDLMPEVLEIGALDDSDEAMERLGYFVKGEFGIPGRRFYLKGLIDRTHHVHAFESGSEGLIRHLAFRDYLRAHPKEAAAYADLKIKLAVQCRHDNDGYCDGKHEFVQEREQRALRWREKSGNE